jgi:glycosyltransferase involved in cell wall biosynthesis
MSVPQTDIVVPVHDALEYAQQCIDSIFAHTPNCFRLILVDDFSQPETTAYLLSVLQRQPESLYVRTAQKKWFTRASNIGLRLVRTQRCILLNSDCVLDSGWLDELYSVWSDAEATLIGRRLGLVGSHLSVEEQRRWGDYSEPGYVTGHCLLLSIPVLWEVSEKRGNPGWYLDEIHREAAHINSDRFLSYELNRMGYATVASFKAAVGHHGGKSWGHNLGVLQSIRLGNPEKGEIFS